MKLVAISDTHLKRPELPEGDVLIHCGDLGGWGTEKEVIGELAWLANQKFDRIIYLPGNHDWYTFENQSLVKEMCCGWGIDCLIDDALVHDGIMFYGSPWTPPFGTWAFMHTTKRPAVQHWAYTTEELRDRDYPLVLITHGPPYGIFDQCPDSVGCPALLDAIVNIKPILHIFGHIHEGHGKSFTNTWSDGSKTTIANVAVLDRQYKPVPEPIFVFDTESRCICL